MKTFTRMILKDFFPVMLVSLLFFVMVLELVDIFGNLWQYLNNDVDPAVIFRIYLLYIPKSISYVLPVSILFSVSYILGNYFQNNELIAILNSGVSLRVFVLPLIFLSLLLTLGSFYFEDRVVIPTFRKKAELSNEALGIVSSLNNSRVTLISGKEHFIYHADFYNDQLMTLSRPLLIERDEEGNLFRRIDADSAKWDAERNYWVFRNVRIYKNFDQDKPELEVLNSFSDPRFDEPPETFRKKEGNIAEMTLEEARIWITSLKKAGLPYRKELTDYYGKFSFPFTIFIVTLLSCALGSQFKKNILLMSLLVSLGLSVIYYILQMVLSLMATYGYIPPLTGAWAGFVLFLAFALYLFRRAKT